MRTDQLTFYATAIGTSVLGSLVATLLGWSDDAVFGVGMILLWIVLFIFIGRDPKQTPKPLA